MRDGTDIFFVGWKRLLAQVSEQASSLILDCTTVPLFAGQVIETIQNQI